MSKAYRTIPARDLIDKLPTERRARIARRTAQLVAEQVALSELRKGQKISQTELARRLRGKQVYVSRFERRSDVRISGLAKYVEALGGTLDLVVSFPDDDRAYALTGLGSVKTTRKRGAKRPRRGE